MSGLGITVVTEQSRRWVGGGTTTATSGQLVTLGGGMVTGQTATDPGYLWIELDPNAGGGSGTITYGVSGSTSTTLFAGDKVCPYLHDPSTIYISNSSGYTVTWAVYR